MSEQTHTMHDVIDPVFKSQARLNEALADDDAAWDRATKTRMRKEVNKLKEMMGAVLEFKDDVPEDLIHGIEEVIVNTEAKLDNKPMHFSAEQTDEEMQAA